MHARAAAAVLGALVLVSAGLPAPPSAAEVAVRAEVVTDTVEGLPTARDAAGEAVVDPGHDDEAEAEAEAEADPSGHDGHGHALGAADHRPVADGAAGGVRSDPVTPSTAFSLVGFSIPAGAGVSFRHRRHGDEWSEWQAARVHLGEAPDRDAAEAAPERDEQGRYTSLPAWTGPADELQVRVDGARPEDLAVHLVDGLGQNRSVGERLSDAAGAVARALRPGGQPATAAVDRPDIVTRDEWGAQPSGSPSYADEAQGAVLHHTVTSNSYSPSQAPAVVRSIQSYHIEHQGWKDIGYNFLVDRYGTVYEGRAGGVTAPVIGAHVAGHNTGSIGVAFLGQHHSGVTAPAYDSLPGAAEQAAVELVSWLFDVHGIDARATGTLPSGYTYPSWAYRIIGHGSLGSTSCPGTSVNDRLPHVRQGVLDVQDATEPDDGADDEPDPDEPDEPDEPEPDEPDDGDGQDGGGHTGRGDGASDPTGTVERVAGPTRQATAVEVTRESHYRAAAVVLASASDYPDALAGAGLAGQLDAPVLLTARDGLDDVVAAEITRLEAGRAVLLGSEQAIGEQVAGDLADLGLDVERVAGPDRFATAAAAADRLGGADTVVVANGVHGWPDAVAASQLAARRAWPVLLTATEELPGATADAIAALAPERILMVGGTSAVSAAVADELGAAAGDAEVVRVAGSDRLATAEAVLAHAIDAGADPRSLWLASAGDWPDALTAGPAAARRGDALLLTWPDRLAEQGDLADRVRSARRVRLVGGQAAISADVERAVAELLGH